MPYKAFINHFNISTPERHTLSFTLFKLIINHVNAAFIDGVITYLRKNNEKGSITASNSNHYFYHIAQCSSTRGGGGSRGGSPSLTKELLEQHWNDKAGPQSTPIAGILAHWTADACGTLNGQVSDVTQCGPDTPKGKAQ